MRWAVVCLAAMLAAMPACRRVESPRSAAKPGAHIAIGIPSREAPIRPLVFSLTQTRLLRIDQAGHERPALIARWAMSPDGLTWTFDVSEGIRYHDGREATAADVVALLRKAAAAPDSLPGLWPVIGIDLAGPRQVRVRLREPTSLLLESLSMVGALDAGPYRETPDGEALPGLDAVPQPAQRTPQIRSIALRRYDTPRAALAALLRDEVDVLYELPIESRALLTAEDGVRVYPHLKPYVVTLGLNHRHPVLARRGVRLAMNALVDRAALVAEAAGGGGAPAADILWQQHWSNPHTADAEAMRVDRDRARRLLDRERLPARRKADGSVQPRFRVACLVLDDPTMVRVAGRLQQLYGDAGIVLDLQLLPLRTLLQRLAAGDFETFLSPIVSGYGLGVPYMYFAAHGRPHMIDHGYTAAARAAERVRRAATDDAVVAAVGDLHRVLLEDPPAVSLYWQKTSRALGPRVRVPADSEDDVLGSLSRWTVTGDRR